MAEGCPYMPQSGRYRHIGYLVDLVRLDYCGGTRNDQKPRVATFCAPPAKTQPLQGTTQTMCGCSLRATRPESSTTKDDQQSRIATHHAPRLIHYKKRAPNGHGGNCETNYPPHPKAQPASRPTTPTRDEQLPWPMCKRRHGQGAVPRKLP